MPKTLVPQPLKWHGGKAYLAKKIIERMPIHLHYVEPYFGGGAVLLSKSPDGVSEVVNDLNAELSNFWTVLQSPESFAEFQRSVEAVPFSEPMFDAAKTVPDSSVSRAVHFFIRCRQSLAGRMKGFTGITKTRTRRGMNNEVSAWLTAVEGLPMVHERLKRVLILNRDALDVIRGQDNPQTLFYCDPPYLKETRAAPDVYAHEMTEQQHRELLDTLGTIQGKFMLSGYRSTVYDECAEKLAWTRHDFEIDNKASSGKEKRKMIECVWCNF